MPELPEVESVLRQLEPRLSERRILAVSASPQARFSGLPRAEGTRILGVRRRGKYLIARLRPDGPRLAGAGAQPARREPSGIDGTDAGALELVLHLGMTGSLRYRGDHGWEGDEYVRATLTLDDGVLDFRDVRRFGRLSVVAAGDYAEIPTLATLGPEPLSDAFDPVTFHRDLAASRSAVKPLLLSQRPVAGVGNIYADEALWRARINPRARRIGPARAERLWAEIRRVLTEAIAREGTTFRDYLMVNGASGRYAEFLIAYGQAGSPCPRCRTPLKKTVVGGRGTTYCPSCQRG